MSYYPFYKEFNLSNDSKRIYDIDSAGSFKQLPQSTGSAHSKVEKSSVQLPQNVFPQDVITDNLILKGKAVEVRNFMKSHKYFNPNRRKSVNTIIHFHDNMENEDLPVAKCLKDDVKNVEEAYDEMKKLKRKEKFNLLINDLLTTGSAHSKVEKSSVPQDVITDNLIIKGKAVDVRNSMKSHKYFNPNLRKSVNKIIHFYDNMENEDLPVAKRLKDDVKNVEEAYDKMKTLKRKVQFK